MTNIEIKYPLLNKYGRNLTEKYKNDDEGMAIIGREVETRRSIEILSQKYKNNLILVGFPGVGKSALIEGIAQKIAKGNVAEALKNKELWEIDLATLSSKDESDGGFQIRLKKLIEEIEGSNGEVIPFIDEFHTIMGAGSGGSSLDAANILKPALARGTLHMIGATTYWEYKKYLEADAAMTRRFARVNLNEPTPEQAFNILRGRKRSLEIYHGVTITDDAIQASIDLSMRYIQHRYLPDKAIDVLDQAAAVTRLNIDSMPGDLDLLQNKIANLQAQIKLETDSESKKMIHYQIEDLRPELESGIEDWELAKLTLDKFKSKRQSIETLNIYLDNEDSKQENKDLQKIADLKLEIKKEEDKLIRFKETYKRLNPIISDEVNEDTILNVIESLTKIPVSQLSESELDRMRSLEKSLHKRIIGQEKAVNTVSYAIKRSRLGLGDPDQPIGSFLFLGPSGVGKAQPVFTSVPTPNGNRLLKKLSVGDKVFDRFGKETTIKSIHPQGFLDVYLVKFSDGRSTYCNDQHLWSYFEKGNKKLKTSTLREIIDRGYEGLDVPINGSVEYDLFTYNDLYIVPWLILSEDNKLKNGNYINEHGQLDPIIGNLNYLLESTNQFVDIDDDIQTGVLNKSFLNSSINNREQLIQGFLDASSELRSGVPSFYNDSVELVEQVRTIFNSLGIKTGSIKRGTDQFYLQIYPTAEQAKKLYRYKFEYGIVNLADIKTDESRTIKISEIEKLDRKSEMLCIYVDNDEHLYLTNDYIVTHNTELVKTLAEYMFGDESAMIRFDMGEFQDKRSISRLIGAAPGDDAQDSGGELTEWAKNNPYSIILFDEAEKAHYTVWDLALSLLDEGELTDSRGEKVNFKNTIIILTSNLGSQEIIRGVDKDTGELYPQTEQKINAILRNSDPEKGGRGFRPEFVNRIDAIVTFFPLTREQDEKIATLKLRSLKKRLKKSRKINLVFSEKIPLILRESQGPILDVSHWIAAQLTPDELNLGGRPIQRYITTEIEDRLVDLLLDGEVQDGGNIYIQATYPEGKTTVMSEDGQQRPVDPIIKMTPISDEDYDELILYDPVELFNT